MTRLICGLIALAAWSSPPTPDIGRLAAPFLGEWTNGKHTLRVLSKGHDRIGVTDKRFESEGTVRGETILLADWKLGKPTDDLSLLCVLELTLKKEALEVVVSGEQGECDAHAGGKYRRAEQKAGKK